MQRSHCETLTYGANPERLAGQTRNSLELGIKTRLPNGTCDMAGAAS